MQVECLGKRYYSLVRTMILQLRFKHHDIFLDPMFRKALIIPHLTLSPIELTFKELEYATKIAIQNKNKDA